MWKIDKDEYNLKIKNAECMWKIKNVQYMLKK